MHITRINLVLTIQQVLLNAHNDSNKHFKYFILILLMRKPKQREVKKLLRSHTTGK